MQFTLSLALVALVSNAIQLTSEAPKSPMDSLKAGERPMGLHEYVEGLKKDASELVDWCFKNADFDGDEILTYDEVAAALAGGVASRHVSQEEADWYTELFASADGQDGAEDLAVSSGELHNAIMKKHATDFATEFTDAIFSGADTDDSGSLDCEEIAEGVAALKSAGLILDGEVDKTIADVDSADADGDGLVSREEFYHGVLHSLDKAFGGEVDAAAPKLAQLSVDWPHEPPAYPGHGGRNQGTSSIIDDLDQLRHTADVL